MYHDVVWVDDCILGEASFITYAPKTLNPNVNGDYLAMDRAFTVKVTKNNAYTLL